MLKRALFVVWMWAFLAFAAFGQSTTVSGNVTDASSQTWNNGTYSFQFIPNPQYPNSTYTWTGGAFNSNAPINGSLSGSGTYSASIPSNANISPINSQWKVTFCPQATAANGCYTTAATTIFGATQTLNATPPPVTVNAAQNVVPLAYADSEIIGAVVGTTYFNSVLAAARVCTALPCSSNWTSSSGGTPASQIAPNTGIFTISNNCSAQTNCLQWTDDDSTDNCGSATTTFMAAINAYAGAGQPQVIIGGSGVGKAYKLATASCHLEFDIPAEIHLWATLDCAQPSGDNCIQIGATGQVAYTVAGTFQYVIDGPGVVLGCVNLTTGCIHVEPFVVNGLIAKLSFKNTGATNGTQGNCTNYSIFIDNPVAQFTVQSNQWQVTDSSNGRCAFANPNGQTNGTNTIYWINNTLGGQSATNTSGCSSQGIIDGGAYGAVEGGNNIYAFGVPVRLQGIGHRVTGNAFDTAGCTASAVNAAIQIGAASSGTVVASVTISDNVVQFGSGHTTNLLAVAGNSTATLANAVIKGNLASIPAGTQGTLFPTTLNCAGSSAVGTECYEYGNPNIAGQVQCGAVNTGWQFENIFAGCSNGAQAANLGSTALFTPNTGKTTLVSCQIMLTQAATTSSTLPQCVVSYTDLFTSTTQTLTITPAWAAATAGCSGATTNTLGNSCQGTSGLIIPKTATAVNYSTTGYASVGGTPMQYQVFVRATAQ